MRMVFRSLFFNPLYLLIQNNQSAHVAKFEANIMFTWLNKQGVRSDSGFEVQFTGRFSAEYKEGSKVVKLYVESGLYAGMPCIIIEPKAFERWSNGVLIPEAQRVQMFQNLKEALEFQGLKMTVE
jgi:hypothetical protein